MKYIVYLLLGSIFFAEFLFDVLRVVGRPVALLPDILSMAAMSLILVRVLAIRRLDVHPKYWIFFALFCIHVVFGIILNTVPTGAVFSGLRTYFRYLPFFLVPAVYEFSDDELKTQLKFLLALTLIQFPLTVYQRFVQFAGKSSGDDISGTLVISSHLSIVLIWAMAVAVGFYLKEKLSAKSLILILIILFLPTTLNETKGSLFLIPIALIAPVVLVGHLKQHMSTVVPLFLVGGILIGGFVTLYNQSLGQTRERSLTEFFAEGEVKQYLFKGATGTKGSGYAERIGRVDSVLLAFKTLSEDVSKLGFGLGIGNVGESFSKVLEGEYSQRYAHMWPHTTTLSFLLWETGLVGIVLVLTGCLLVFGDAKQLSKSDDTYGALALGWGAVVCIYVVSMGYKNLITPTVLGYLFWYFSGCVAAERLRRQNGTLHAQSVNGGN